MELRTYDRKDTFEDIIEDQIVEEDIDTFYTSSIEEELNNENFYKDLNYLEKLLELDNEKLKQTIEEDEDLKLLLEKSEIDIDNENLKNELKEVTLNLELMFINNILNKHNSDIEISEEINYRQVIERTPVVRKIINKKSPSKSQSVLNKLFTYIDNTIKNTDSKVTKWFNKTKFGNNLQKVPFYKRKAILISAGVLIATVISMKIYIDKSFILNPRFYKEKMDKLKDKKESYNPNRIISAVPASSLSDLKRDSLSTISNIERLIDDILDGADMDKVYAKLMSLNLSTYGMSFNAKNDGRLKVKRKSINRKMKKITTELGYGNGSYNNIVRDLNQIREKFLKTHEKIIDLQINFIENPTRYENVKPDVVKRFLPSLITILKYIFDTVFRDFYNTAYSVK